MKTDKKDALHLGRLLRLGEITPVAVPTVAQEAARDLVRAREDVRGDLMRARHRVSKLLLRHGHVYYGGAAWTGKHTVWLNSIRFDQAGTRAAFDADREAVDFAVARRARLEEPLVAVQVEDVLLLLRARQPKKIGEASAEAVASPFKRVAVAGAPLP